MAVAPGDFTGLAGVDGTLYTLGFLQQLYRVNPATAGTTLIGSTGIPPATDPSTIDAVTAAGLDSSIYLTWRLVGDTADDLYRIDPNTAQATLIGPITGAAHFTGSGVIGGSLYGFTFGPNNIYRIDVNTGVATLVGSYAGADAPVFAAAPVPEPSGMAAAGLLLLAWCAYRRCSPRRNA